MGDSPGLFGSDEQLIQRQSTYELFGSIASDSPIQSVAINVRFVALNATETMSPGAFALVVLNVALKLTSGVAVGTIVAVLVAVEVGAGVRVRVAVMVAAGVGVRVSVCVAATVGVLVGVSVRVGVTVTVGAGRENSKGGARRWSELVANVDAVTANRERRRTAVLRIRHI